MPCLCGAVDCPSCSPGGPWEDPGCSGCGVDVVPGQDGAVEGRDGRRWCRSCLAEDEGEPDHAAV